MLIDTDEIMKLYFSGSNCDRTDRSVIELKLL